MKTTTNLINLKERHANFKALSVLNLARTRGVDLNFMSPFGKRSKLGRPLAVALNLTEPFGVASNLKRACREKSNLALSCGASVKFASSQGGGLNFTRPRGAEFQKGRA